MYNSQGRNSNPDYKVKSILIIRGNLSIEQKMRLFAYFLLFGTFIIKTSSVHNNDRKRTKSQHTLIPIGGVIEQNSRIGREQKIAMEIAIHNFCTTTNDDVCSCPILHIKDSQGNPARIAYEVIDIMKGNQVEAIIGTISPQEATFVAEFDKRTNNIPIISLNPTATSSPQPAIPSYLQMCHDIKIHMQCIAAIVGHFSWRKVTPIYEDHIFFSSSPGLLSQLSDALQRVDSTIERSLVFPPLQSLSNPNIYIKTELKKLKMKENRVFVVLKSSLQSCILLFKKANQLGMMEKGYVWIISDDISSLLDSVDQSIILTMQGVIGFKTNFVDTSERFTKFKLQFRKDFRIRYPNEEEYSNPSIYALRAYDATSVTVKAIQASKGSSSSINLLQNITNNKFDGVSGDVSFKDGKLAQFPTFRIINVIGRSYKDIEFWSPKFGFSNGKIGSGEENLNMIVWPGGTQEVPTGQKPRNNGKPLKIGVPARGAFKQFVNVSYDPNKNKTYIAGFSIQVFEAAVKKLDYTLSYVFVPYYGSYDDMVTEVHNKTLDAAVGDTEIMADRYEYAEFSQPYMESGLVIIVPLKPDSTKEWFIFFYAFTTNMWIIILTMTIGTGSVVWFNEHLDGNEQFKAESTFEYISKMLWFSIAVITLSHKEPINNNLSRLALATWFCVNVILAACFTATLSSIMTISMLQPELDLQRSNSVVGCNGNSFIVRYLENVLHFRPEKIRHLNSLDDYDDAFKNGEIAAAFFVAPHANVFLAKYCRGYKIIGRTYKLGGFGFVFRKGSRLVQDISKAVLKVTQNGDINTLELDMLRRISNCSGSVQESTDPIQRLGLKRFAFMLMFSGGITTYILFHIGPCSTQSLGTD
ncbi:glutamate receptor 2.9-like [Rutidosis leptorrhynchoides]|uniref:glutamate receptor 2.9-like n=1 Tax=Rutidosis leptorrhynchoides TaxID=125765 RepID=UPI003A99D911